MPPALTIEVPDALAEAWRKLPPERRSSVVDYASFLAAQEEIRRTLRVIEKFIPLRLHGLIHFMEPAGFARWAADAARGEAQPIDLSKL